MAHCAVYMAGKEGKWKSELVPAFTVPSILTTES